jgi:hypothetical protein
MKQTPKTLPPKRKKKRARSDASRRGRVNDSEPSERIDGAFPPQKINFLATNYIVEKQNSLYTNTKVEIPNKRSFGTE